MYAMSVKIELMLFAMITLLLGAGIFLVSHQNEQENIRVQALTSQTPRPTLPVVLPRPPQPDPPKVDSSSDKADEVASLRQQLTQLDVDLAGANSVLANANSVLAGELASANSELARRSTTVPASQPAVHASDRWTLPFEGDETSLADVKANPGGFFYEPLVVCGSIRPCDVYQSNFSTWNAQTSYCSLQFVERLPNGTVGCFLLIYAPREMVIPLLKEISKADDRGLALEVRLKILVTERTFVKEKWQDQAELVAWQFLTDDRSAWKDPIIP